MYDNLDLIRQKIAAFEPDVIFNLLDWIKGNSALDQHIAALLELQCVPFSGCGALELTLAKHKGIAKQILSYHRIRVLSRSKRLLHDRQLGLESIFVIRQPTGNASLAERRPVGMPTVVVPDPRMGNA